MRSFLSLSTHTQFPELIAHSLVFYYSPRPSNARDMMISEACMGAATFKPNLYCFVSTCAFNALSPCTYFLWILMRIEYFSCVDLDHLISVFWELRCIESDLRKSGCGLFSQKHFVKALSEITFDGIKLNTNISNQWSRTNLFNLKK